MFNKISEFFSQNKVARQKQSLLQPQYAHLFDTPPTDEWVSLDLEMTGLNPKTDHILSLGAVKIAKTAHGVEIDTGNALSLICRPPVMPSRDSIIIHGLRPSDVENGISYEAMLPQLLDFIGNRPVVGFCVDMDMAFINAITKPWLGVNLPNAMLDVSLLEQQHRQQANRNPDNVVKRKHLNELIDEFAIPRLPTHDSLNDAIMVAMVFAHLNY
ncbi:MULTISPECIES: 3'-5' exonuclease [unclassified Moraxella]|uniref:3'-5' exonuclease n=1 Tax=unclassified Moraxella TaxID=2685852 RepID=UPI003AF5B6CB